MSGLLHTHIARTFGASVTERDGRKALSMNAPDYYQTFLNSLAVGDTLSVEITNKKPKRTTQQNSYYWGVYLPTIAKETGEHDLDRLHALFKAKFLTKEIAKVLNEKVRITRSTTDLSVSEFAEFIMHIEELTGVAAPPVENFDLAPLKS